MDETKLLCIIEEIIGLNLRKEGFFLGDEQCSAVSVP